MIPRLIRQWLAVPLFVSAFTVAGSAQDGKPSDVQARGGAVGNRAGPWVCAPESRVSPLRRTVSLRLNNVSLQNALDSIARSAGATVATAKMCCARQSGSSCE